MNSKLCTKLTLTHSTGKLLYPVLMKNLDTDRIAFRLSKKGNTKEDSIEISDVDEMIKKVTSQGYAVRARTDEAISKGGLNGLYRLNERAIKHYSIL